MSNVLHFFRRIIYVRNKLTRVAVSAHTSAHTWSKNAATVQ